MDTDMEYVPMNIKQEVEPATTVSAETNQNTANNNSSQAAPDSVENKVSRIVVYIHPHGK
jgi:hypothetical protein